LTVSGRSWWGRTALGPVSRFKEWNDAYGHACGDALLREIAGVLRSVAAPDRDLVARNGGDEFCIVFTETDKATAIERADLLRRRIAAIDCSTLRPAGARGEVRITASLGVAALAADAEGASDLLECADAAMYHTKQTGRDGVSYVLPAGGFSRLAGDREEEAVRLGQCVEGRA
jgi:diguanylate cyclase (GGDEF)-like protein